MHPIIKKIRKELKEKSDPKVREGMRRYFKEDINSHGLKAAAIKEIAAKYWNEIRSLGKKEIFDLSEDLMKSLMIEEIGIVTLWIPKLKKQFEEKDLDLFKKWIEKYIDNWANCDSLCNHTVGDYIMKFPHRIDEIKSWTKSKNRWMRRAAAVSLIVPARRGEFLEDVLEIADLLLEDEDDMVQKGYGWMLKEASKTHQTEVFNYVIKNKSRMPRTAFRYAIEKMDQKLKVLAMKKDN